VASDPVLFLMAFASLTELNSVKRSFRGTHLPMRQLPANTASWGCGFGLALDDSNVAAVSRVARESRLTFRLFRVQSCGAPEPIADELDA